jgi:hypothetical protein
MKVFSKFRLALRSVYGKIVDMTKGLHLNYSKSNLNKVKGGQNITNHHD